jgi:hypothetical protein
MVWSFAPLIEPGAAASRLHMVANFSSPKCGKQASVKLALCAGNFVAGDNADPVRLNVSVDRVALDSHRKIQNIGRRAHVLRAARESSVSHGGFSLMARDVDYEQ